MTDISTALRLQEREGRDLGFVRALAFWGVQGAITDLASHVQKTNQQHKKGEPNNESAD